MIVTNIQRVSPSLEPKTLAFPLSRSTIDDPPKNGTTSGRVQNIHLFFFEFNSVYQGVTSARGVSKNERHQFRKAVKLPKYLEGPHRSTNSSRMQHRSILIRWPINRSNRFSDFLRLDRLDRFYKIIKSSFLKFWKREFQFFRISRISSDFWSCGKNIFFCIKQKFPVDMSSGVVEYSLSSSDVEREALGSNPIILYRRSYKLEH